MSTVWSLPAAASRGWPRAQRTRSFGQPPHGIVPFLTRAFVRFAFFLFASKKETLERRAVAAHLLRLLCEFGGGNVAVLRFRFPKHAAELSRRGVACRPCEPAGLLFTLSLSLRRCCLSALARFVVLFLLLRWLVCVQLGLAGARRRCRSLFSCCENRKRLFGSRTGFLG